MECREHFRINRGDVKAWRFGDDRSIETFRLEYEDDYEYEFQVLSTRNSKIFVLQT